MFGGVSPRCSSAHRPAPSRIYRTVHSVAGICSSSSTPGEYAIRTGRFVFGAANRIQPRTHRPTGMVLPTAGYSGMLNHSADHSLTESIVVSSAKLNDHGAHETDIP